MSRVFVKEILGTTKKSTNDSSLDLNQEEVLSLEYSLTDALECFHTLNNFSKLSNGFESIDDSTSIALEHISRTVGYNLVTSPKDLVKSIATNFFKGSVYYLQQLNNSIKFLEHEINEIRAIREKIAPRIKYLAKHDPDKKLSIAFNAKEVRLLSNGKEFNPSESVYDLNKIVMFIFNNYDLLKAFDTFKALDKLPSDYVFPIEITAQNYFEAINTPTLSNNGNIAESVSEEICGGYRLHKTSIVKPLDISSVPQLLNDCNTTLVSVGRVYNDELLEMQLSDLLDYLKLLDDVINTLEEVNLYLQAPAAITRDIVDQLARTTVTDDDVRNANIINTLNLQMSLVHFMSRELRSPLISLSGLLTSVTKLLIYKIFKTADKLEDLNNG